MSGPRSNDPLAWTEHFWRQQRLGDPRHFIAMASLLRLHQVMTAEIDRLLKDHDLTWSGYLVLATVQLSEDGSRLLSRIATHMLVHPTTVTLLVDKLAEQGLLVREPHPTDRRATYARITPAGTKVMQAASSALQEIGFGLPGVSAAEAARLTTSIDAIRAAAGDIEE